MKVHKFGNGQYAVCFNTVNYFEVWQFSAIAGTYTPKNDNEKGENNATDEPKN